MSLSNLLHYESDDDDEALHKDGGAVPLATHVIKPSSSPPITAAPTAIHPVSHSTQPVASLRQIEKRALSDDEHEAGDGSDRKRTRTDSTTSSFSSRSSSPASYIPPPASFFSFTAPSSSSTSAASTDLLSFLPPPKNTHTSKNAARQPPIPSASVQNNILPTEPSIAASSPPPRPPTPPPTVAAITSPLTVPPTSVPPAEPTVAAPPGVRKRTASLTTSATPTTTPFQPYSTSLGLCTSRIAYSTASPYAVQPSSQPSIGSTAVAAESFVSYEEPRMQRQWLEADHIVDVRVDDLTQPPSAADTAAAQQLQSASAVGDVRVKTTYWDARQGKEVTVTGVAGRQQRAHQINSLAIQAKKLELDMLRVKEHGAQIRRDARSKYGW